MSSEPESGSMGGESRLHRQRLVVSESEAGRQHSAGGESGAGGQHSASEESGTGAQHSARGEGLVSGAGAARARGESQAGRVESSAGPGEKALAAKVAVVAGGTRAAGRGVAAQWWAAGAEEGVGAAPLGGKVALVAGGTRAAGRGVAVQLGAAGATVYVTGRSTRARRSEMGRPETIEETAELVDMAGGRGIAVRVDHTDPVQVRALVERIEEEQGELHILVNDIWGQTGEPDWDKTVWEASLENGLRLLRLGVETHAITSHFALPLLLKTPGGLVVEMTDGTDEYNATNYRVSFFYDVAKGAVSRMAFALAHEVGSRGATAVLLTPGWLRSEAMLEGFGVTEENWRDATTEVPHFAISESPSYVGRAVAALAADPDLARWNGKSTSSGELAKIYGFTDLDGSQPDAWRYIVEVQDPGKPADTTGYR